MHWITVSGAMTLHALLAVVFSASLIPTGAQGRVVVLGKDSSSSSSSTSDGQQGATNDDLQQGDYRNYLTNSAVEDEENFSDKNDDDDDDDDDDNDMDVMWPVLCPPNAFYDLQKDECTTCSSCPAYSYMIEPCNGYDDTMCIPFYQLQKQGATSHHSGDDGSQENDDDDRLSSSSYSSYSSNNNNHSQRNYNTKNNFKDSHSNIYNSDDDKDKKRVGPPPKTSVSDEQEFEWKSVSLALLICTSVIFVCLASMGAVFCYLRRRTQRPSTTTTKEIVCKYGPAPNLPPIVEVAVV